MHHRNKHDDMDSESEEEQETAPLLSASEKESPTSDVQPTAQPADDARFNPPAPAPWKRIALLLLLIFSLWAGFKLRAGLVHSKKPKVIHASRYSKEFKFRPAASPIVTETLKDGRVRLRGAPPAPTLEPLTGTSPKKNKKKKAGNGGKRKSKVKPGKT